ncbi:protein NLRC3-like isoform X4 [Dysidea avara]|uniref:protein NLRC3-like isoform X4 n=1 Tax=Dysidea avara TaxID=196820 RepID=UPI00331B38EA
MEPSGMACHIDVVHGTGVPTLKDLCEHVTPWYAAQWKTIGLLLGLPKAMLQIIEHDNHKAVACCNALLEKWIEVDPSASWNKLLSVLRSPIISGSLSVSEGTFSRYKGTCFVHVLFVSVGSNGIGAIQCSSSNNGLNALLLLSKRVKKVYVHTRFLTDTATWPPDPPKVFTPLVLIHHQGQHTFKEATAMAKLFQTGSIGSVVSAANQPSSKRQRLDNYMAGVLESSKVTKNVTEMLAPLENNSDPQFVLFEGSPGIGKSVLLKEIAYQWGKHELLQKFKTVLLLCLRDPSVQKMSTVSDLLSFFCKRDIRATEITSACNAYIFDTDGKDVVFLLDGYDELPGALQNDSLIADIIARQVLPECGLIISSRPHASVHLRDQATLRVDILGFTEQEQKHFIEHALQRQPEKITELIHYLDSHLTISSLCYAPFNMVVLVFLCKQGVPLPKNSTELYNYFICLTISRHLVKSGVSIEKDITDLTDIPDPCGKVIQQLSQLSLKALSKNQLVFTLNEIKEYCPLIETINGAINGFGLLQTVEHYGISRTTKTFNFTHFSVQEFLAAHYLANLSPQEELTFLKRNFWRDDHANMFMLYVALTKGQKESFKQFLCDNNDALVIADKFLSDPLKCLRLFRCFSEADDMNACKKIETKYSKREISFRYMTLSPNDVESIAILLTCSSIKNWKKLYLYSCYIQDQGVRILHRALADSNVAIEELQLSHNGLTASSDNSICDLVITCKVKVLIIGENYALGETENFYPNIVSHPSSVLKRLDIWSNNLSSSAAISLFTALKQPNHLRWLYISYNDIDDEACNVIAAMLKHNKTLERLMLYQNPISEEAALGIMKALENNETLLELRLPKYSDDVTKSIAILQETVNKNRELNHCNNELDVNHY